jgi:hypothetical protein
MSEISEWGYEESNILASINTLEDTLHPLTERNSPQDQTKIVEIVRQIKALREQL